MEIYGRESTLNAQRKCMLWANSTARVKDLNFGKSAALLAGFRTFESKSVLSGGPSRVVAVGMFKIRVSVLFCLFFRY